MVFDSLSFFVFLGAVLVLHRLLPWRSGRVMLVAASYIFYGAADPRYCLLLVASTAIDFSAGLLLEPDRPQPVRRRIVIAAAIANLGLLAFFKYTDTLETGLNAVLGKLHVHPLPMLHIVVPIGISFYTFQSLSYSIDVYRRRLQPTHDIVKFSLYVSFFPQLVAGPIERGGQLLPQLEDKRRPSAPEALVACERILFGLIKKCVVADRLALIVDPMFAAPNTAAASDLFFAGVCFAFQLLWDFSAYTDIAIGVAALLGVKLAENFNRPFLSRSPAEFMQRWHMSLTRWFRDYALPVVNGGTERPGAVRAAINVIVVMTLVGLWHGAAWNFIFFGAASGVAVAIYSGLRRRRGSRGPLFGRSPWMTTVKIAAQFLLMMVAMIAFRAVHLWPVARRLATGPWQWNSRFAIPLAICAVGLAWQVAEEYAPALAEACRIRQPLARGASWAVCIVILSWLSVDANQPFIYYQF